MKGLNFFIDKDTLFYILNMDLGDPEDFYEFSFDIIDAPYWMKFYKIGDTLKAFDQSQIYTKIEVLADKIGSLIYERKSGHMLIETEDENLKENMGAFYIIAKHLCVLIKENNLDSIYGNLDSEKEGVMITVKEGGLNFEPVSGPERPNLTVGSAEGTFADRPYADEILPETDEDFDLDSLIVAAEDGILSAMKELARIYIYGHADVEPDPEKAFYWFYRLAEIGDPCGMYDVGVLYAKGYGCERDYDKAVEWMEKTAATGDKTAERFLKTFKKVPELLYRAIKGDSQAQGKLALYYFDLGNTLNMYSSVNDADYHESLRWAKMASAQGNPEGYQLLYCIYRNGSGVKADIDTAMKYLCIGAELGDSFCQYMLGCKYADGEYFKKDEKKAYTIFKKLAEEGNSCGMRELGKCYQFAKGCTGNLAKALEWYTRALETCNNDYELKERVDKLNKLSKMDVHWDEDFI